MSADERVVKRRRYTSRIITLRVGKYREELTVHEDKLRQSSPFFRAALDRKGSEGMKGEVELPEDKSDIVAAYVDWLYSGKINIFKLNDEARGYRNADDDDFLHLVRLYVFAEKGQDVACKNDTLSVLFRAICESNQYPSPQTVRACYEGTSGGSPARRVMVDVHLEYAVAKDISADDEKCPEFLADLTRALLETRRDFGSGEFLPRRSDYMERME